MLVKLRDEAMFLVGFWSMYLIFVAEGTNAEIGAAILAVLAYGGIRFLWPKS